MKNGRIAIYLLLGSACAINFLDRVVLSVAAGPIAKEFGLSTIQLGYLFSAFLWTYLVFVLPWGMLVDRIGTRRATTWGMAIFSGATVLTGLSGGFVSAFMSRLMMGLGEASTYPCAAKAIREWAPKRERGLASTMFNVGGYAGPAVGAILMGYLVEKMGWRGGFFVCAAIGFAWMALWLIIYRRPEDATFIGNAERTHILIERGAPTKEAGMPMSALLRCPTLWGLFLVQGCAVYTVYFFISWLPSYFQKVHGLTVLETGLYTAIPYGIAVPGTLVMAWLSDRLLRNAPANSGRRRNMVALMMLCASSVMFLPMLSGIGPILMLLAFAITSIGSAVSLNIALLTDLLPNPANIGSATGVLVTGGNVFGVLAPIATGYVISRSGSYDSAFVVAAALLVVGAMLCLIATRRPIEPTAAQGAIRGKIAA